MGHGSISAVNACPRETRLSLHIDPSIGEKIDKQLSSWLKTGDDQHLTSLLGDCTQAILLPVVDSQINHLRGPIRLRDFEDIDPEHECWPHFPPYSRAADDQESLLPDGVKLAARDMLIRLLKAWIRGFLGDYTIEPAPRPAKRRGPKHKQGSWFGRGEDLLDFYAMLRELYEFPPEVFRIKRGESDQALIKRLAPMVQDVHRASMRSDEPMHVGKLRQKARRPQTSDASSETAENTLANGMKGRCVDYTIRHPLPRPVLEAVIQQAKGKRKVPERKLVYSLLAAYQHFFSGKRVSLGKIRRDIERHEEEFPGFYQDRPRRET